MKTRNREDEYSGIARVVWALLVAFATSAGPATAGEVARAPEYEIEPCCDLCTRASDPASYDTGFLELFRLLVEGEGGWLFRSEQELREDFGPTQEGLSQLRRFARHLKEEKGTDLVLVFHPTKGLVHPDKLPFDAPVTFAWPRARDNYREALGRLRDTGMIVPDLTPLLAEPPKDNAYYFERDHHWSPYGARRAARLVAQRIRQMPVYSELEKKTFETRRVGLLRRRGTLQVAAERLCGFSYPNQYVNEFRTELASSGDDGLGDALFGEASLPSVTLVGTSFSKGTLNFNFAGALQQFLGVEVLNLALTGGSYDGAILDYLKSDSFHEAAPEILIWEVPAYHQMNNQDFYRQLMPLVTNACETQPPILQSTATLKAGVNEVIFNGGGRFLELPSPDHVIDIKFSDPSIKRLEATTWFVADRNDRIKMEYSDRTSDTGRFVFELPKGESWEKENFMSLELEMLPEQISEGLTVTAKLCKREDL